MSFHWDQNSVLGIVVIGRNEGDRLRVCLESVCTEGRPVVYVDSGSTDGSVELAQRMGAAIVSLDMTQPFSAGRGRNSGAERLLELAPGVRYVQFVDGDCEIVAGWLENALSAFARDSSIAVVCGRRRERHPEASVYNAICDIEWDLPIGFIHTCGGDAMMDVHAFQAVGGFDARLIAGEEPELCVRLRGRGWRILRLAVEMTLHDAAMTQFSQWWKRSVRSGHAYAELASLHGRESGKPGVRQSSKHVLWGAAIPASFAVLGRSPQGAILFLSLYSMRAVRIFRHELELGRSYEQAFKYSLACVLGNVPEALGVFRFWWGASFGRRSRIIEYKR